MTHPGPRLCQRWSPTADLYLEWSLQAARAEGRIERLSPTVFRHAATLIVLRHLSGLRALPRHDRLVYVIDDDWRAGLLDGSLPPAYRCTLAFREALAARWIETRAEIILVASEVLAARYRARHPGKTVAVLEPAWPEATSPLARPRPSTIAYLSAATHRRDFLFLQPVLRDLLERREIRLTISGNLPVPRSWHRHERVEVVPAMDWNGYRHWMTGKSFDIGLYPACRTPFNTARSRNKLLEFDQFGAALLCSQGWEPGDRAAGEGRCLAVPDRQEDWARALTALIERSGEAASLAAQNREVLRRENPLAQQQRIWEAVFAGNTAALCA
jgi:hypothetical protein